MNDAFNERTTGAEGMAGSDRHEQRGDHEPFRADRECSESEPVEGGRRSRHACRQAGAGSVGVGSHDD
jgi:hypothetical protein